MAKYLFDKLEKILRDSQDLPRDMVMTLNTSLGKGKKLSGFTFR